MNMKLVTASGALIALVFLISGCATKGVVDKPYDEVKKQVQGMWKPMYQGDLTPIMIDLDTPPIVRDVPAKGDVHGRRGWLWDSVEIEEQADKTTYTVNHHFETSGAAVPWAQTLIVLRQKPDDRTDVAIWAYDIGLFVDKRDRVREHWILGQIVSNE